MAALGTSIALSILPALLRGIEDRRAKEAPKIKLPIIVCAYCRQWILAGSCPHCGAPGVVR